jgi:hypothetical protein
MSTPRRIRKTRGVQIATLGALALLFQGCGDDEPVYCVDEFDQVVENENCYADEADGDPDTFFWYYGSGVGKAKKGIKLKGGERVAVSDFATIQSKGGFGGSGRPSGIGRAASSGG